ncbi:MAG: serine hydrolase domain-containing protein [Microthrixaceae bacterium]
MSRSIVEAVAERLSLTGAQWSVTIDGVRLVDQSIGDTASGPMTTSMVHQTYCLSKMLLSAAYVIADRRWGPGPDAPLGEFDLPESLEPLTGVTVAEILEHRVGLRDPTTTQLRMSPPAEFDALVAAGVRNRLLQPAFSEAVFGVVLEAVIESLSRQPADRFIIEEILEPVGIAESVAVNGETALRLSEKRLVTAPVGGLPVHEHPMLSEVLPQVLTELRPATGVLWSMSDAATFATELLAAVTGRESRLDGIDPEDLAFFSEPRHPSFFDEYVDAEVQYAGGMIVGPFMASVSPLIGPGAFGEIGGLLNTVVVIDPHHDAVVTLLLNGVDPEFSMSRVTRTAVISELYREHILDA